MLFVRLLALASLALRPALAATAADEADFLQDLCDVDGDLPWCDSPVTPPVYCNTADVTCDADQRIVQLLIGNFDGAFPNSGVVSLDRIRRLEFYGSVDVTGSVSGIELLTTLNELVVDGSFPIGTFPALPTGAGGFVNLVTLIMRDVDYEGTLPESIAGNGKLEVLIFDTVDESFDNNNGVLPSQLSSAPLRNFTLQQTGFVGTVPPLGQTPTLEMYKIALSNGLTLFDDPNLMHSANLETFELSLNALLEGNIPPSLGSTTTLRHVVVFDMPLFGASGDQLGPLLRFARGLEFLSVAEIAGKQAFPVAICELENLRALASLSYFVGTIPTCLAQNTKLQGLTLTGPGSSTCDPTLNLVGPLPQAVVDVVFSSAVDENAVLAIVDTCLNGTLPETTAPLAPIPFMSDHSITITGNLFVTPYPEWMRVLQSSSGWRDRNGCNFVDNRFCEKPLKGVPVDELECPLTLDGSVNVCGQCERPDSACADCRGVINGLARVDRCGVCAGTNDCVDCAGVVNGTSVYDSCDVCNGDDSSCIDCTGVLGGSVRYDLCGVCGGDGSSCLDCAGIPFGTRQYDICDLCGGSGAACADCAGVIGGSRRRDVCGDCVDAEAEDYVPSCIDCAGTPFGTLERDECFVCGGDGSTCDPAHALAAQIAYSKLSWLFVVPIILSIVLCALCIFAAARMRRRRPAAPRRARASLRAAVDRRPDPRNEWIDHAMRQRQRALAGNRDSLP